MFPTISRMVPCPWLMFSKAGWIAPDKDGFKYTAVSLVRLKCCPLQMVIMRMWLLSGPMVYTGRRAGLASLCLGLCL